MESFTLTSCCLLAINKTRRRKPTLSTNTSTTTTSTSFPVLAAASSSKDDDKMELNLHQMLGENSKLPLSKTTNWYLKQPQMLPRKNAPSLDFSSDIDLLSMKKMPHVAQQLFLGMKSEGFSPCSSTLTSLMLCYADNGLFQLAQAIWIEIINSSYLPNMQVVSHLMNAYGKMGHSDEVVRILHQVVSRDSNLSSKAYSAAISCFGKGGQLELMETMLKEMVSSGVPVDSSTGNAFLTYYSNYGSLSEMEGAYARLKRSRILIEEEGIRALASAYIHKKKFYKLGEFVRDVGLGRRNVGNLLWNLLLLSYAANFKMKSLQREFLGMTDAGFSPDLTTFNIRLIAFSRMSLFWDLLVSVEHMKHERVNPDLVSYGCIVDTFLDRKLGRNLNFALNKFNVDGCPHVSTELLVFEVFGKGDFHSSSDVLLDYKMPRKLTYRELIKFYLKKKFRSNQIFWNY